MPYKCVVSLKTILRDYCKMLAKHIRWWDDHITSWNDIWEDDRLSSWMLSTYWRELLSVVVHIIIGSIVFQQTPSVEGQWITFEGGRDRHNIIHDTSHLIQLLSISECVKTTTTHQKSVDNDATRNTIHHLFIYYNMLPSPSHHMALSLAPDLTYNSRWLPNCCKAWA